MSLADLHMHTQENNRFSLSTDNHMSLADLHMHTQENNRFSLSTDNFVQRQNSEITKIQR